MDQASNVNRDPQTYPNIGAATEVHRGLLINYGAPSLDYKRPVLNLRESAQSADEFFLKEQSLN